MTFVQAAQVIYGNVEADQSPKRRGGYHMLFHSVEHISEEDISHDIVPRLTYPSRAEQQTKRMFFVTYNNKVVIAQIVPLPGTDQFGRAGRYIAHALVFSHEAFQELDNNPFFVFDHYQFFSSLEEAFKIGDSASGNIPAAQVHLSHKKISLGNCNVSRDQLFNLTLLAHQLPRLSEQNSAVGFYGQPDKTFEILKMRIPLKVATHSAKWPLRTYWAIVGGIESPPKP